MPGGSYLRANFRIYGGALVLPVLEPQFATVGTNLALPSGMLVGLSADACALLLYKGDRFLIWSCDTSTGA